MLFENEKSYTVLNSYNSFYDHQAYGGDSTSYAPRTPQKKEIKPLDLTTSRPSLINIKAQIPQNAITMQGFVKLDSFNFKKKCPLLQP